MAFLDRIVDVTPSYTAEVYRQEQLREKELEASRSFITSEREATQAYGLEKQTKLQELLSDERSQAFKQKRGFVTPFLSDFTSGKYAFQEGGEGGVSEAQQLLKDVMARRKKEAIGEAASLGSRLGIFSSGITGKLATVAGEQIEGELARTLAELEESATERKFMDLQNQRNQMVALIQSVLS